MNEADLPLPDLPPGDDESLPRESKPRVKGIEVDRGEWSYAVEHDGETSIVGPWPAAYARAQTTAAIQAMVLDALGGPSLG